MDSRDLLTAGVKHWGWYCVHQACTHSLTRWTVVKGDSSAHLHYLFYMSVPQVLMIYAPLNSSQLSSPWSSSCQPSTNINPFCNDRKAPFRCILIISLLYLYLPQCFQWILGQSSGTATSELWFCSHWTVLVWIWVHALDQWLERFSHKPVIVSWQRETDFN